MPQYAYSVPTSVTKLQQIANSLQVKELENTQRWKVIFESVAEYASQTAPATAVLLWQKIYN